MSEAKSFDSLSLSWTQVSLEAGHPAVFSANGSHGVWAQEGINIFSKKIMGKSEFLLMAYEKREAHIPSHTDRSLGRLLWPRDGVGHLEKPWSSSSSSSRPSSFSPHF